MQVNPDRSAVVAAARSRALEEHQRPTADVAASSTTSAPQAKPRVEPAVQAGARMRALASAQGDPNAVAAAKRFAQQQAIERIAKSDTKALDEIKKAAAPKRTLMRGDTGDDVKEVQQRLNAHGAKPPLATDGKVGDKTELALKRFQRSRGLPVTGVVDEATRRALAEKPGPRILRQ